MTATNPMEAVLLQQQQAKQEAEEAGLDFNSMVRRLVGGCCSLLATID